MSKKAVFRITFIVAHVALVFLGSYVFSVPFWSALALVMAGSLLGSLEEFVYDDLGLNDRRKGKP